MDSHTEVSHGTKTKALGGCSRSKCPSHDEVTLAARAPARSVDEVGFHYYDLDGFVSRVEEIMDL